ncbi:MAG: hypothetical protein HN337_01310 [Deltaproteobacteria bacterium]|jgi:hypothetical protein|nr:hypothetical protein [Deltaproteobacteria bacterium]
MRYFLVVLCLIFVMGCGSSGSGGSSDLSCAPDEADRVDPTVDLDGSWTLTLTETSSTCDYPPDWISCDLTMSVSGNNVTISGNCVTDDGVTISTGNLSGIVSGDTLYWGATMSASVDTYTETGTVPCTAVDFTSSSSETFSVTVSVEWSDSGSGTSDTCTTSFSGVFN